MQAAAASLKNVHIIAGDVVDYKSLEVKYCVQSTDLLSALTVRSPKRAASQVSAVTGGKLDYLIHNAALLDASTTLKGFDD